MRKTFLFLCAFITLSLNAQVYTLSSDTFQLGDVYVKGAYTAPKIAPFSFTNIEKQNISLKAQNYEPAVLLSSTPSVTLYSDNGTGLGYTYYRLRGIDQTRINVTLNGVPMNEPEDQGIYFNNYPNFLNSVSNVQIIRGAGLSKSGVSSYGGSINFESLRFTDKFSGNASIAYGSFNTFQLSGGINTKKFFINASSLNTDGYKYNSFNKSGSVFYGANLGMWKLYGFVGNQKNGMAWLGESLTDIKNDPRFNSQDSAETDNFLYIHNQLNYAKEKISFTIYHTYLNGGYNTDNKHFGYPGSMGRLAYESNWLGSTINYNPISNHTNLNMGVSGYGYVRNHEGLTDEISDYTNKGYKVEVSPYLKGELIFGMFKRLIVFGDIQYRYNEFLYDGSEDFPTQIYNFLNWSGGATFRIKGKSVIYYGVGKTFREPTRTDLFSGLNNYDPEYFSSVSPESVFDNEIGYKYFDESFQFKGNFYYMQFKNEIVLNGEIGPNAILIHQNVDKSYRTGIELDGRYKWYNGFEARANTNFSFNQIQDQGVVFQPVLTPSVIINLDGIYNYKKLGYVGLNIRHNSKSYIDLSNDTTLPRFTTFNAYAGLNWKGFQIQANANNLFNKLILTNGIIDWYGDAKYFIMAGRNAMITFKYTF